MLVYETGSFGERFKYCLPRSIDALKVSSKAEKKDAEQLRRKALERIKKHVFTIPYKSPYAGSPDEMNAIRLWNYGWMRGTSAYGRTVEIIKQEGDPNDMYDFRITAYLDDVDRDEFLNIITESTQKEYFLFDQMTEEVSSCTKGCENGKD